MALPLSFDFYNKIITVPSPDVELDLQYLINQIRYAEETLNPGIQYKKIADAFGKQDLGGGVKVGITVVLLDGWRVAFEARPPSTTVSVRISGGNFVGEAGANPVAPTAYTQVTVAQSSSATIIASASDTNLVYLVESLRNSHPAFGSVFYWDPYGGSDSNAGTSPSAAVKTFSQAQTLVSGGNNDLIFCRPTDPAGTVTITETLNITKSNLKVRGPGNSVKFIPTSTAASTVNIAADHIEFSGFYLETAGTGTQNAITIDGDNVLIRDCWVGAARGHGIALTSSARFRLLTSVIENCGGSGTGDGINIGNSTTQSLISKAIIYNCKNGIALSGTGITDNIIENSLIYKNTAYGITVGSGVLRTTIRDRNTIINNTTANTQDLGTDTYIETQAGGESASAIADAVWDEVISGHVTSGTTGKTLKDAKLKATLASLK